MKTLSEVEGRNDQFEKIASYRRLFASQGLPILSIDTKKKELLGNFSREGTAYATGERPANDHDFPSAAEGKIVPHGIYDVSDNTGYITLGTSKDTSEFVCDNIQTCWTQTLQYKLNILMPRQYYYFVMGAVLMPLHIILLNKIYVN